MAETENAECDGCGVTAADLPYEDLGLSLDEASEFLFERDGGSVTLCQGCSSSLPPAPQNGDDHD